MIVFRSVLAAITLPCAGSLWSQNSDHHEYLNASLSAKQLVGGSL